MTGIKPPTTGCNPQISQRSKERVPIPKQRVAIPWSNQLTKTKTGVHLQQKTSSASQDDSSQIKFINAKLKQSPQTDPDQSEQLTLHLRRLKVPVRGTSRISRVNRIVRDLGQLKNPKYSEGRPELITSRLIFENFGGGPVCCQKMT